MLETMTEPKKPSRTGRDKSKKPQRSGKPINVWLPLELHAALTSFMEDQRIEPKLTDVVEVALQEFLQREGFWPPPSE